MPAPVVISAQAGAVGGPRRILDYGVMASIIGVNRCSVSTSGWLGSKTAGLSVLHEERVTLPSSNPILSAPAIGVIQRPSVDAVFLEERESAAHFSSGG